MHVKRAAWSLVGMLVVTASVSAQTPPPLMRFAGVVPATAGAVPGSMATLTFAVYADQQGGTPLWTETQTVTLDAEGRYAGVLGSTQPTGLPLELFTSGEARWLGVSVAQGPEAPRVLLVSVPYALKAADATTVAGKPLSAFVLAGDKTGTGADGLTYVNTQALSTGFQAAGGGPQTGNVGTANYLGVFTDETNLGNSVMYQNGTNYIGVNTTSPLAPFHVVAPLAPAAFFDVYSPTLTALPVVYRAARGTPTAPSAVQAGDILGGLAVRGFGASAFSAGGRGQVAFLAAENWTDTGQGTALVIKTNPTGAAGAPLERLRVTPAGNVGIGTTTPGQLLSVAGTIESTSGGFEFPDGTTQTTAAIVNSSLGNSAFGINTLPANTTSSANTAFGYYTLSANISGSANTASGFEALAGNTTGYWNTASGASALVTNTTGSYNTATGAGTLYANTTGTDNAAHGAYALASNTTGSANSASGYQALKLNTTGYQNTASGYQALVANTTANYNTATGSQALYSNTTGWYNTATGSQALYTNTTGTDNTASGMDALYSNTTGSQNTASGYQALLTNTTGSANSASGYQALKLNTTGYQNTASGYQALIANTTANYNTATGSQALYSNTTGWYNTATGSQALYTNTTGTDNTASGMDALYSNTTGSQNTASGYQALLTNTTGGSNTASGYQALWANTTGYSNIATGDAALYANTIGNNNAANGDHALYSNTTGNENTATGAAAAYGTTTGGSNTAIGYSALNANTTGGGNLALGYYAGSNLTTGSYNIDIGNIGVAGEGNTIRIGTAQTQTFIVGIRGVTTGLANAVGVVIDGNGQLGTVSSSRRFKDDIADMAGASSGLIRLRPVTFHYKSDQNPAGRTLQYGLIAEEVAEVYPGLVARSKDGQAETVLYQFLPPMLLNEYQKQQRTIETQQHAIETLQAQVEALTRAVAALSDRQQ